jgi:type I restriction enzyme M protein
MPTAPPVSALSVAGSAPIANGRSGRVGFRLVSLTISPGQPEEPIDSVPEGYLIDYISKLPVRSTPEERDAVQVFARRLVEDLGYPIGHIQTRPQFHVRQRPSESPRRGYPLDIAVFASDTHEEDGLQIVVECKRKNRREGRRQLELYLTMSHAEIGAWFNGDDHLYLRKRYVSGGEIAFDELPAFPRYGQRLEDIGRYRRKDLLVSQALRPIFRDIRNHLAGNLIGITRDEALAQQIINVLFCKVFDEMDKGPEQYLDFRAGIGESPETIHQRIMDLFAAVKTRYGDVFSKTDTIEVDPVSLAYVVGELQNYSITEASRDAVGDAFEVFIGPALRGTEGQFFTPRNVVRMMVDVLAPKAGELIIDPACGSGGFLIVALEYVWRAIEEAARKKRWSGERVAEERRYVASQFFKGIEKDRFLAKVTKAYMAILGDGRSGIYCENSLLPPDAWDPQMRRDIKLGAFDVVITNPPFGTKIPIKGKEVLEQFDLGHQFERDKDDRSRYAVTVNRSESQAPQLLFIERCLQLLKPGGRLGIVLPESVFGMPTYTHVVQWLRKRCTIIGIVSMPEDLFQPHTHAKTCVVFIKNSPPGDVPYDIFMSVVEWCGHDSRGNETIRRTAEGKELLLDDVPLVAGKFQDLMGDVWNK